MELAAVRLNDWEASAVTTLDYDPSIQNNRNGPLTKNFARRVVAAKDKHKVNYGNLSRWTGISSAYLANFIRSDTLNVSSDKASRLSKVVEQLEKLPKGANLTAVFPQKMEITASGEIPASAAPLPEADAIGRLMSIIRKAIPGSSITVSITVGDQAA